MKRAIIVTAGALLLAVILGLESCRTAKDLADNDPSMLSYTAGKDLYEALLAEIPDYDKVSIKCLFTLGNLSSRAQVRMIKGEFVQVSFMPVLGIEMLRLMLTPDSIYVMDRLNGIAAVEAVSALSQKIPGGAGIPQIQSLLLGAPFKLSGNNITENDYDKFRWSTDGDKTVLHTPYGKYPELKFTVGKDADLAQTHLSDGEGNTLISTYSMRKKAKTGGSVPGEVSITISLPGKYFAVKAGMNEITYDWEKTFEPDTAISKRYTRISFDDFIKTYIK